MQFIPYLGHELEVDGEPRFFGLGAIGARQLVHFEDVLVQEQPIVPPLGEEVAGDLHRVLDVVDLAHVEPVQA